MPVFRYVALLLCVAGSLTVGALWAQEQGKWVTAWAASPQGPYPVGNASAQPLLRFAFPSPPDGARDQTFRLVLRPDVWGTQARLRFTNAFGTKPVTFEGVRVGLHWSGGAILAGTNRVVRFGGKAGATVAPGAWVWSDPVVLSFDTHNPEGRKLAVSFHIPGESGPMTWHAKGLQTSYLSAPGSGSRSETQDESAFPFTTTSWFFLDAVDMMAPASTRVVVAFGDSITDGTSSTLNGDDRWPDVLARRLHARFGNRYTVVNAGIGGNRVTGPAEYSAEQPSPGGPSALQRLERDVLSLSGVTHVIWLEGINDFGTTANASVQSVQAAMREGVSRMKAKLPGLRVIGATVVSALGSTNGQHGSSAEDEKRKQLNEFIRTSGVFDAVVDFDRATLDSQTGGLRAEFVPDSTTGGPGDKLHPNRAGYQAMAMSIDLDLFSK